MWSMTNTYLPSGSLDLSICQAESVPIKNPGHWVSSELPWFATFPMCCLSSLLGGLSICYLAPLERTRGSAHLVSQDLPRALFHFADCAWYPLAVVNDSREYNYGLNAVSHDSHSYSSDDIICPYFSYQSNSGPHPSFTKADICCHFWGSLLSLELWKSPERSSHSVAAAISLLLLVLWPRHFSVVSLSVVLPAIHKMRYGHSTPSLPLPVPKFRQLQKNTVSRDSIPASSFLKGIPSLPISDN